MQLTNFMNWLYWKIEIGHPALVLNSKIGFQVHFYNFRLVFLSDSLSHTSSKLLIKVSECVNSGGD